ncbi:MAG: hypothetical protein ABI925_11245 [Verrucomicrobiota bacterium]
MDPVSRDMIERLEQRGCLTPFRKYSGAKALYPKWQVIAMLKNMSGEYWDHDTRLLPNDNEEPAEEDLRRGDVLAWLGIPRAELESWVRLKIIRRKSRGNYSKTEIKTKVLGSKGSKTRKSG